MILHAQEASHGPVYLWHLGPSTRYAAPMLPALLAAPLGHMAPPLPTTRVALPTRQPAGARRQPVQTAPIGYPMLAGGTEGHEEELRGGRGISQRMVAEYWYDTEVGQPVIELTQRWGVWKEDGQYLGEIQPGGSEGTTEVLTQGFLEHGAVKGGMESYQRGFADKVEPGQESNLGIHAGALLGGTDAMQQNIVPGTWDGLFESHGKTVRQREGVLIYSHGAYGEHVIASPVQASRLAIDDHEAERRERRTQRAGAQRLPAR
jgi:hypothetical protein